MQVMSQGQTSQNNLAMENMDSNGDVPGFEDLGDEVVVNDDMAQSNLRMSDDLVREGVREIAENQSNSNSKPEDERARTSNEDSLL